jgi:serine protease
MNHILRRTLAGIGVAALAASALPLAGVWLHRDTERFAPVGASYLDQPQQILVDLIDTATARDVDDLNRRFGLVLQPNSIEAKDNKLYRSFVLATPDQVERTLAALRQDPRVEAADPDVQVSLLPGELGPLQSGQFVTPEEISIEGQGIGSAPVSVRFSPTGDIQDDAPMGTRPNDPRYDEQWNFKMVGAEDAWKRTRGKGAVVAVIDTGVSGTTSKKGKACRDFGTTSFAKGYDFVNDDDDPFDDHAHGTHVAGTIAESTNNNEGVAGLAFEATIMPLKVLSASGSGSAADIADAIRWAADHGANVINMSLGANVPMSVVHKACQYAHKKGVVIVCAAGNSFKEGVGYPAAYPECIAVSSVGPSGTLAKYSSWGKEVALAAPGGDMIDSRDPKDGILQNTLLDRQDDYYAFQGTSMASPHVAAAAALVVAQGIKDPAQVKEILTKSASPVKDNDKNAKKKYGAGVLNLASATKIADATDAPKLRHLLWPLLGVILVAFGGPRRNLGLRLAMGAAVGAGFFAPDFLTHRVFGFDSAWNLLSFSALVPAVLVLVLRNGPGIKVAGALSLGVGVNLFANWHNDTLPFTTATFGSGALPWTALNLMAAFALSLIAGRIALRRMR